MGQLLYKFGNNGQDSVIGLTLRLPPFVIYRNKKGKGMYILYTIIPCEQKHFNLKDIGNKNNSFYIQVFHLNSQNITVCGCKNARNAY